MSCDEMRCNEMREPINITHANGTTSHPKMTIRVLWQHIHTTSTNVGTSVGTPPVLSITYRLHASTSSTTNEARLASRDLMPPFEIESFSDLDGWGMSGSGRGGRGGRGWGTWDKVLSDWDRHRPAPAVNGYTWALASEGPHGDPRRNCVLMR